MKPSSVPSVQNGATARSGHVSPRGAGATFSASSRVSRNGSPRDDLSLYAASTTMHCIDLERPTSAITLKSSVGAHAVSATVGSSS